MSSTILPVVSNPEPETVNVFATDDPVAGATPLTDGAGVVGKIELRLIAPASAHGGQTTEVSFAW